MDSIDIMLHNPEKRRKYGLGMMGRLHEIGDRAKNMQKMIDLFEREINAN